MISEKKIKEKKKERNKGDKVSNFQSMVRANFKQQTYVTAWLLGFHVSGAR